MFAPAAGFDVLGMSAAVTKLLPCSLKEVVHEGLVEWALVQFADNLSGRCWPSPWLAEFDASPELMLEVRALPRVKYPAP